MRGKILAKSATIRAKASNDKIVVNKVLAMPLVFPNVPPHYLKSITLPNYNTLIKEFPDGGETRIQLSTIGAGTSLNLSYVALDHTQTASIMTFYASTRGEHTAFLLPSTIINHSQSIKDAIASLKATTYWLFDGQPSIKPDYANTTRGLYSLDIKIISTVS